LGDGWDRTLGVSGLEELARACEIAFRVLRGEEARLSVRWGA